MHGDRLLLLTFHLLVKLGDCVGRPLQLLASNNVKVQVVDRLEGVFAAIVHNAIAIGNIHALRQLCSDYHHMPKQRLILLRLCVHIDH